MASKYNFQGRWKTNNGSGKLELDLPFPSDSEKDITIDTTLQFYNEDKGVCMGLKGFYYIKSKLLELVGTEPCEGWSGAFGYTREVKFTSNVTSFDLIDGVFTSNIEILSSGTFTLNYHSPKSIIDEQKTIDISKINQKIKDLKDKKIQFVADVNNEIKDLNKEIRVIKYGNIDDREATNFILSRLSNESPELIKDQVVEELKTEQPGQNPFDEMAWHDIGTVKVNVDTGNVDTENVVAENVITENVRSIGVNITEASTESITTENKGILIGPGESVDIIIGDNEEITYERIPKKTIQPSQMKSIVLPLDLDEEAFRANVNSDDSSDDDIPELISVSKNKPIIEESEDDSDGMEESEQSDEEFEEEEEEDSDENSDEKAKKEKPDKEEEEEDGNISDPYDDDIDNYSDDY